MSMSYFLSTILPVIVCLIVAIVLERVLTVVISRYGQRRNIAKSHVHLMKLVVRWAIVAVFVIVVAGIFGMGIGSLWATITGFVALVVIGFFAVWSILSNVLATLLILVLRPFQIGDRIAILPENLAGEVIDMNLMYTKLTTDEGDTISVPNNMFITKFIKVYSKK